MKVRNKKESLQPGRVHAQGGAVGFPALKKNSHFDRVCKVNGVISQVERAIEKWVLFLFFRIFFSYYFAPRVSCLEKWIKLLHHILFSKL